MVPAVAARWQPGVCVELQLELIKVSFEPHSFCLRLPFSCPSLVPLGLNITLLRSGEIFTVFSGADVTQQLVLLGGRDGIRKTTYLERDPNLTRV